MVWLSLHGVTVSAAATVIVFVAVVLVLSSLLVTGGDERNDNKLALDADPDAGGNGTEEHFPMRSKCNTRRAQFESDADFFH